MGGIMDMINVPLGYIIKFCYFVLPNYALALLLFAIVIKAILFPFGIKQQKNMIKQAALRPKEAAIRKRYAGRDDKVTQQKMQEEVMALYQKENYNPVGGCLPLVIQLPILFALYNVIRNPLTYICTLGAETVTKIKEVFTAATQITPLSEIDMVGYIRDNFAAFKDVLPADFTLKMLPDFTVIGGHFDLSLVPSFNDLETKWWLLIVPALTFIVMFLSMKLTRKYSYQPPEQTQGNAGLSMKIMDLTMPLFSVWITFTVPAVVGIYWIYQNILGVLQQMILVKMYPIPKFTEDDFKAAEKEMNGTVSQKEKKRKDKPRSLHNIDKDDPTPSEQSEKKNTEAAELVTKAPLKEDRDGNVPPEKQQSSKTGKDGKPKPRSLHRIDEEDNNQ